jgi:hypothetical protein
MPKDYNLLGSKIHGNLLESMMDDRGGCRGGCKSSYDDGASAAS